MLSSHLLVGHPSRLFSMGLPIKSIHAFLLSPTRAACPTQHTLQITTVEYDLCETSRVPSVLLHRNLTNAYIPYQSLLPESLS
jgi:hypothetical protein